jgi:hypothetical protein
VETEHTLEMGQVALLVELRLVQAETVGDIKDRLCLVLYSFFTVLGRRVAADVEGLATNGNLLAVGLVDSAVDLLEVVGVGDDLIVGDDVLCEESAFSVAQESDLGFANRAEQKGRV